MATLAVLVLIFAACGGEAGGGGDEGKASTVVDETIVDETTSARQEPAAEKADKTDKIGTTASTKRSKVVLAEIDEKGGPEEYMEYLALQEVDPFWAQQFAEWADSQQYTGGEGGLPYTNANAVIFTDESIESGGCGTMNKERGTVHCPLDTTIYFSLEEMMEGAEDYGPFFLAFAVAHEWGHHVQDQLGYFTDENNSFAASNIRAIENHADCLAGVWARSYYERGHLNRTAIFEGIRVAFAWGDRDPNDGEDWGTPEERVRWFLTGYTSGDFPGCSGALVGTGLFRSASS